MSQENVEIVRRGVEALNAGDLDRHCAEFFDPEVEWRTSAEDPDAATHRGLGAYRRYIEQWLEGFEGLHVNVEEFIDVGADRVLTWNRYTGRGRERASLPTGTWRSSSPSETAGLCAARSTADRAEALEAAGLSE